MGLLGFVGNDCGAEIVLARKVRGCGQEGARRKSRRPVWASTAALSGCSRAAPLTINGYSAMPVVIAAMDRWAGAAGNGAGLRVPSIRSAVSHIADAASFVRQPKLRVGNQVNDFVGRREIAGIVIEPAGASPDYDLPNW